MNFEQLVKFVHKHQNKIKNKKRTKFLIKYAYALKLWKKKKLKLGDITFEIREPTFKDTVFFETIEIRFINQDNTVADEEKLENILKKQGWRWDARSIIAALVVIFGISCEISAFFKNWYFRNLPMLAFRSDHYDFIIYSGFDLIFGAQSIGVFLFFNKMNFWLIDVISDFCIFFNIIF